jgi:hypothetical protein
VTKSKIVNKCDEGITRPDLIGDWVVSIGKKYMESE